MEKREAKKLADNKEEEMGKGEGKKINKTPFSLKTNVTSNSLRNKTFCDQRKPYNTNDPTGDIFWDDMKILN